MGEVKAPPPRNLYTEGSTALDAQIALADPSLRAESEYSPRSAAIGLNALQTTLLGDPNYMRYENRTETLTPDEVLSRYGWDGMYYHSGPKQLQAVGALEALRRDGWKAVEAEGLSGQPMTYQRIVQTPVSAPQRGFLDLYANEIAPAFGRANAATASAQRMGDVQDVGRLAGQARTAFDSLNPLAAQNYNRVAQMDAEQLQYGTDLSPFDQRRLEQGYRGALTTRGLSLGQGDAAREALNAYAGGEQMRQMRRGNALQSATALQGFYGDPFQQILGRPSGQATSLLNSAQGQNASTAGGPQMFNPFNPYASDLFNTNYNAEAAARIGTANNQSQIAGAVIGGILGLGGKAMGG